MNVKNKQIVILGSTGSIGCSTIDVISRHPERFTVRGLAAHSNIDRLEEQYYLFKPDIIAVADPDAGRKLADRLIDQPVSVLSGEEEIVRMAGMDEVEIVVNAVVGAAGLRASLRAVQSGKRLALANKESLVAGGPLFAEAIASRKNAILPIDSEHSAIWQALRAGEEKEIRAIILTSSGGPFRTLPADQFDHITVEQALNHPTWKMGAKITIDSATLANKGLEVIEAAILFSLPVEQIRVVVHPQSIVHSMVEFCDSSVIAQLSQPDMRLPISYALFWPERVESPYGQMNFRQMADLTFEEPDLNRFGALKLAFEVARAGGTAPAVYNAANEVAVEAFLNKRIRFTEIVEIIRRTVDKTEVTNRPTLEDILNADRSARHSATEAMEKIRC